MERINLSLKEIREAIHAALKYGWSEDFIMDAIYDQQLKVGKESSEDSSDELEKEIIIWDEISSEDLERFETEMEQGENAIGKALSQEFPGIEI